MKKILFICTGNTCRSSMAEGIFKSILESNNVLKGKYKVSSAGIYAYDGDCASDNAVSVLRREWDADISSHRSRKLNASHIDESSIILTMTGGHKDAILDMYPGAESKVFTLKEYVSPLAEGQNTEAYNFTPDITDPYGMPERVYKHCAEEIHHLLEKLAKKLENDEV